MILNWFSSATVRQAVAMRRHVLKLLNHQRDILGAPAIEAVQAGMNELQEAIRDRVPKAELVKSMEDLEKTANKWLKPYPHAAWRENVEVLLVALAVAMGIRTFFLQPFKIPTGSMQPTLFGVTSENLLRQPDYKIPTGWDRVREWFAGVSYVSLDAEVDGPLQAIAPAKRLLILSIMQTIWQGGQKYTIWSPPDYGAPPAGTLEARAGLRIGEQFKRGEPMIRLKVSSGDHLFVDRFTYNFRTPKRGEIVVFETRGINGLPQDQFYIKRLVALGGENVKIGDDRHLVINGSRLDASVPHFEHVYSFNPKKEPRDSEYSGHVNYPALAPHFWYRSLDGSIEPRTEGVTVPPGHYMVMGDNTMNSLDSRAWGDFPSTNVIGKSWFVYWPITDRFGWSYNR